MERNNNRDMTSTHSPPHHSGHSGSAQGKQCEITKLDSRSYLAQLCTPYHKAIRDLKEALQKSAGSSLLAAQGQSDPHREQATRVLKVIDSVIGLSYPDYQVLIGLINHNRDSPIDMVFPRTLDKGQRYSSAVNDIRLQLRQILDKHRELIKDPAWGAPLIAGTHKVLDGRFGTDALRLVRMLYFPGVNLINPTWDPNSGPMSIPIDRTLVIRIESTRRDAPLGAKECGTLVINPNRSGDGVSIRFIHPGEVWSARSPKIRSLVRGECAVIGRPLGISSGDMGIAIDSGVALPVSVEIDPNYTQWSRGALLLIVAPDGKSFYLSDQGMRHPIVLVSPQHPGRADTYIPNSVVNRDGEVTGFGKSVVREIPHRLFLEGLW